MGRDVSTFVHARWRKLHHHQVHTKGRRQPFRSARQPQPTPFTKRDSSRLDPRAGSSKSVSRALFQTANSGNLNGYRCFLDDYTENKRLKFVKSVSLRGYTYRHFPAFLHVFR